jgi:hypothetical protein
MSNERGLAQLGGVAFVASGLLFFANAVLQLLMGPPPSTGSEILSWMAAQALASDLTPEVLFFAVGFMIPAAVALYENLARTHRGHAALGVGMMAATIPIFCGVMIVAGRFPYPIFGLKVHTPEIAEFALGLYYGGLHAAALLLAGATFVVSLAMRRGTFGPKIAYLGFATAAVEGMIAYPDIVGPTALFLAWIVVTTWFVAVGIALYRAGLDGVMEARAKPAWARPGAAT